MILIPKFKNMIEVGGSLSLVLIDTDTDTIRKEVYVPNLVVTLGKTFIASRMVGTATAIMSHMGIGIVGTTEVVANSALASELVIGTNNYSRAATTTATNTNNIVTYSANFAANNPNAPTLGVGLLEAGIFNASSAGIMLCRTTFPIVTKLPADALTVTWTITIQ